MVYRVSVIGSGKVSSCHGVMGKATLFKKIRIFGVLVSLVENGLVTVVLNPRNVKVSSLLASSAGVLRRFSDLKIGCSTIGSVSLTGRGNSRRHLDLIVRMLQQLLRMASLVNDLLSVLFTRRLDLFTFKAVSCG